MRPLPAASNGISMNPQAGGSEGADSPAIRAEDLLCPTPLASARLLLSLHSPRVRRQPTEREEKGSRERGGYSSSDLCTLTLAGSSSAGEAAK